MGYSWNYFIVDKSTNTYERPKHTSTFMDIQQRYLKNLYLLHQLSMDKYPYKVLPLVF